MVKVIQNENSQKIKDFIPKEYLKNKRKLTQNEIRILEVNLNRNSDPSWNNFFVDDSPDGFDPSLIRNSIFNGFVILGKLKNVQLNYHDLYLTAGIYDSYLSNIVTGDDNVISHVSYFENYHTGNRVILFNVEEISCTNHSKFGNGILKQGEDESKRIWIGIANENDGRAVLPFEKMIPADAYLWSHYREDSELLQKFKKITEKDFDDKLNTFGFLDDDVVIKNTNIVKDAKIGKCVYIKGAYKLKNITILSTPEEESQIGEGVVMVNGILGYGSRVFYSAIVVRFVIGKNCQIKYGARLLNSILGDNSTVSCCEILNNLIFPFHEQHHNSSFLIATTIMGQSNIAAGATVGSNHNSRSPDGEILAKRGFWPGLCSDFKHNSRFASFTLVSKGSYQNELDIQYPFSLVLPATSQDNKISIIPAWWFMYDMYAIARNNEKFKARDKRKIKIQHIETNPMAPDTMQEILFAIKRIIFLTMINLEKNIPEELEDAKTEEEKLQKAKDFLHQNPDADFCLFDSISQKKFGAIVKKPVKAYKIYRKMIKYYAAQTLINFCKEQNQKTLNKEIIENIRKIPLFTEWENVGGQIIPSEKVLELIKKIKNEELCDWNEIHEFYDECENSYDLWKTRHALYLFEQLYSRPIEEFSADLFGNIIGDVTVAANDIYISARCSREKDYTSYYRKMMYKNEKEMNCVLGELEDNAFLMNLRKENQTLMNDVKVIFKGLL